MELFRGSLGKLHECSVPSGAGFDSANPLFVKGKRGGYSGPPFKDGGFNDQVQKEQHDAA
jgi:hypothetical protein